MIIEDVYKNTMIFEIYEKKVIGKLCYAGNDIRNLTLPVYPLVSNLLQFINIVIKQNGLTSYYYYDMTLNRYYFKLDGSITNMLRLRNELRHTYNLNERDDWC